MTNETGHQTPAPFSADPVDALSAALAQVPTAPPKVSYADKKRAAVAHATKLAATNPAFAAAMNNPAAAFETLGKMGLTLGSGAAARKAFATKWKQRCTQRKWDSSIAALAWVSLTWDKDVEVYEPSQKAMVKYATGDNRPQCMVPMSFEPFENPMILMEGELFTIDLDWPEQLLLPEPAAIGTYEELLTLLLTHASFRAMWADLIENVGEDGAMTYLQGQIVQSTGKNGYQLIGKKTRNNKLRQITGALALPYDGPLPEGYDVAVSGQPMVSMDTRCAKDDGSAAGMVFGPGSVIALDDKATDKAGQIVLVARNYRMLAGGNLTLDTMTYLHDGTADFIADNVGGKDGQKQPGDFKPRTDVSALDSLSEVPAHAKRPDDQASLADTIDTPIMRDAQQVKEQLVHSINMFTAERRAMAAAAANNSEPIVRTAPEYERHEIWRDTIMFPLTGSIAFGEFGDDAAKAEEIGQSLMDTATQMFAAAGVNTGDNEDQWKSSLVDARGKVAAGDHNFKRAGVIRRCAERCGWVAPAIAPSAMIQQPAAPAPAPTPAAPAASSNGLIAGGRKRRTMSTAAPKFSPATGIPSNWAVAVTKGKAPNQVVEPVPCEATAAQAASHLGIGGKFNELSGECEIIIPAGTDLAGMEVGTTDLTGAVSRSVAMAAQLKHHVKFGPRIMDDALRTICEERPVNPVVDYLDSCVMVEGITCNQLLRGYAHVVVGGGEDEAVCPKTGLTESQLADIQSELTMVAAVGRAYDPGGEFQQILVIVSHTQGGGKSDMFKSLVPNKAWHGDEPLFGLDPKKVAEQTKGKWIQENAEMQGFSRVASEELKGLISRTGDQARMAFDRSASRNLRRWLMVCTSNNQYFLFDPSGDRRYWPWLVEKVDVAGISRDRDALWAHARHLFFTKYQGNADLVLLDAAFYNLTDMVREKFTIANPKEDKLQEHATIGQNGSVPVGASVMSAPAGDYLWMPSTALYEIIVGKHAKLTNGGSAEVSALLRRQGWKARKFNGARGWRRLLSKTEKAAHDHMVAQNNAAQQMQGGNVVPMMKPQQVQPAPTQPSTTVTP